MPSYFIPDDVDRVICLELIKVGGYYRVIHLLNCHRTIHIPHDLLNGLRNRESQFAISWRRSNIGLAHQTSPQSKVMTELRTSSDNVADLA
jgi:hypothetical protein